MRSIIAVLFAAGGISACAGGVDRTALAPACGPERQVTVTTQGARLALRPGASRGLQRVSTLPDESGVVLSCRPGRGALKRCVVLFEDRPGQGYGRAALAFAGHVIYPSDEDARTVEVRVRFGPAPATAPRCS